MGVVYSTQAKTIYQLFTFIPKIQEETSYLFLRHEIQLYITTRPRWDPIAHIQEQGDIHLMHNHKAEMTLINCITKGPRWDSFVYPHDWDDNYTITVG